MYDNVLIGIKGDADDRRAIGLACRLASPQTRLTLAHISVVSALASEREALELAIRESSELAQAFADQLELAGEGARIIREHATSVGAGLQAAVDRFDADLLVLGSTAHRGLDRLLEGDDVRSTLSRTRCAIAVADEGLWRGRRPITTIGVAYDGTPESAAAVNDATTLARRLGARVIPLHVAEPHIYATGFGMAAYPIEDPASIVEAARTRLGSVGGEKVRVVYGDLAWELAQFSDQVDLLICGSRREGPVRQFVFGSTALSLSRNSHCPLIIAAAPQNRPSEPQAAEPEAASSHS